VGQNAYLNFSVLGCIQNSDVRHDSAVIEKSLGLLPKLVLYIIDARLLLVHKKSAISQKNIASFAFFRYNSGKWMANIATMAWLCPIDLTELRLFVRFTLRVP
jgi:hypothetical protein